MQSLHRALMSISAVAVLTLSLGLARPWISSAAAQHQHAAAPHEHAATAQHDHSDPQEHFHALVERLELTAAQQEELEGPFEEAFAAMQELHRLHDQIFAELTDAQRDKLATMLHEMFTSAFAQNGHGGLRDGHR